MNIDLAALRALAQEREIPVETILAAIETALLTAYRHTDGSQPHARVEIDRKSGGATVFAQETELWPYRRYPLPAMPDQSRRIVPEGGLV